MALISRNIDPTPRQLRQFAGIWFPALFVLIGYLGLHWGWWTRDFVLPVGGALAAISIFGVFIPAIIRPIFQGLMFAVYPIGLVLSHVLVAVLYYGVLTPVGVMVRTFGSDPMTRRLDPDAKSYWIKRATNDDKESYLRQF